MDFADWRTRPLEKKRIVLDIVAYERNLTFKYLLDEPERVVRGQAL